MNKALALRLVRSRQKAKADAEEKKAIIAAKVTELMDQSQRLREASFRIGSPPDWVREAIARNDAAIRKLLA